MKNEEFNYLKIEPITGPIPPKKQEAKRHYGVHPYFTRRAYNVVQAYINNFTREGDLVADPFGGSGVTALESLVLRRRCVHLDINPLANFLTFCITTSPVNLNMLKIEYQRIQERFLPFYNEIRKIPKRELRKYEVRDWYPKDVPLPNNADRSFVHELFSPMQLILLSRIRSLITDAEDEVTRQMLLYVFSATMTKCNLLFSGTKGRKQSRGDISPLKVYRYWMPEKPVELDPWEKFQEKFKKFLIAKTETNKVIGDFYNQETCKIFKGDATELASFIASETVDYIYTDPPYGAHIAYLDLSTMWNAWLQLEVTQEDRMAEIIENGDLNKTQAEYTELLKKSIFEIFKVLKNDRWFSLVFAHKDPLYWDTIIKSAESCGFQYMNMAVVKAGIVSFHKHKNPLHVLSGEMVINFLKKRNPKSFAVAKVGVKTVNFILDSAELSIVQREAGAKTEEIYFDLIPKLVEAGLLSELKKHISDITPLLGDKFNYNPQSGRWIISPNTKLGSHIPVKYRIRFYIESFLNSCSRRNHKATLEDIWGEVIPMLKNGKQPDDQTLIEELEEIAESYENKYWRLKQSHQQEIFDVNELTGEIRRVSGLPKWTPSDEDKVEHNEIIYRLAILGNAVGLKSYVGRNERTSGPDAIRLSSVSLPDLPKTRGISQYSKKKIEQIDLIWFDEAGFPAYAFEIEHSTSILSGIERFHELLKVSLQVAGKIILVCPSSRKNKLDEVLTQSHFIGAPMYMERKLRYLFYHDVFELYQSSDYIPISLEAASVEIRKRLRSPE
jgi:DNA modification methylase